MEQGFNDKYRKRTKDLCIGVIRMLPKGKRSEVYKIFSKQLIRSISSVAANFRATCRAKSNNDYIYKLSKKLNIVFLDLNHLVSKNGMLDYKYTSDGLHFNSEGQEKINQFLKEKLSF